MRRHRFAKIIATLGPATSAPETIRALFAAGVDVFRLNFSHGDHEGHRRCLKAIREAESATGRPIGALLDLQGPKLSSRTDRRREHGARRGPFSGVRPRPDPRRPGPDPASPSRGVHGSEAGHQSARERRQGQARGRDLRGELCGRARQDRRRDLRSQGRQHPRRGAPNLAADRQGPQGSRAGSGAWGGLGGRVVRAASTGRAPAARSDRWPGGAGDEARETLRGRAARRHHRPVGRNHGCARRPRRGASARRRPQHLAPNRPRLPPGGEAGDRGDPDAGVDDRFAGADQSRSHGRRDRDLRRRRRGHALGGNRGGPLPGRGRRHHASDHRQG